MAGFYKAKFEGKCGHDACGRGGTITVGQSISWNPKSKPVIYFHEECMAKIKEGRKVPAAVGAGAENEMTSTDDKGNIFFFKKAKPEDVKVGLRCRFMDQDDGKAVYHGRIYSISEKDPTNGFEFTATVKRDDGRWGGGDSIEESPYSGHLGWLIVWDSVAKDWRYKVNLEVEENPEEKKETTMAGEGAVMPKAEENGHGLKKMAELLAPYIKSGLDDKHVEKALEKLNGVVEQARKDLAEAVGAIPRKIEVVRADGEVKKMEGVHQDFEKLLKLVNVRDHVYLWGPPGSGKSTAAHQVADALGLNFGYISLNPQTPDSRILGYMDAGGKYRPTVFREKYENGGVMCIDEMDNAAPSLCVTINSGLESDRMAFPDGMVDRHKNFVLVATGNTTGRGANPSFPERRPFDAAFAERFSYLEWDYDVNMEKSVTLSINPKASDWLQWVWKLRDHAKKSHPRLIVSPRASFKGAKLLAHFKFKEIAEMVVFKGLDRDTVKSIMGACPWEA